LISAEHGCMGSQPWGMSSYRLQALLIARQCEEARGLGDGRAEVGVSRYGHSREDRAAG
jgi:hypothetical protein